MSEITDPNTKTRTTIHQVRKGQVDGDGGGGGGGGAEEEGDKRGTVGERGGRGKRILEGEMENKGI